MNYFDSHAHLEAIGEDVDVVLARAADAGVTRVITIGDDVPTSEWAVALASSREDVWATAGQHPHHASAATDEVLARIEALAAHPRCVGVGEAGLDYFYDHSPRDAQQRAFTAQIAIAERTGKTLLLHTRDAWDDTFALLANYQGRAVFHCWTGGPDDAVRALAMGAYLSFSGIVTFRNADAIREAALLTPMDRMLIETDAPFLTPLPHRGKRNEPAYVVHTAAFLASLKGVAVEDLARQTADNTVRAFAM
ncbi:MAG: hypothetical protein NVSMB57_02350 [Actinomycetota bacterium]